MRRGRPGIVRTMGRTAAIAGTATVTSAVVGGAIHGSQAKKQAAAQQQAAEQQAAVQQTAEQQAAPVPAAAPNDVISQLKELAQLKDAGILTEEEFETQKQKILAA